MSVRSILKGVTGWFGGGRKPASHPGVRRARPRVEGLEERLVLAPDLWSLLTSVPFTTAPAMGSSIPNLGISTRAEGNGSFFSGFGTPLGGNPYGPLAPYLGQRIGGAPVQNPLGLFSGPGSQVAGSQVQLGGLAANGATTAPLANATYNQVRQGNFTTNQLYTNLPGVSRTLSGVDNFLNPAFGGFGVSPPANTSTGGPLGSIMSGTLGMDPNTQFGGSLRQLGALFPMGLPGVPGQLLGTGVNYGQPQTTSYGAPPAPAGFGYQPFAIPFSQGMRYTPLAPGSPFGMYTG
jgi:hypothetical protein